MKGIKPRLSYFTLAGILAISITGCSRNPRPSAPEEPPPIAAAYPASAWQSWQSLAILKTGAHPLWFEFSDEGPRLIPSPAEASLADYTPWPHARFCAGLLVSGTDLVLAINREGFLIVSPAAESGSAILYRAADAGYWDPYTIASVLIYEENPAVILYRDDFFVRLTAPPPEHPLMVLSADYPLPFGVRAPAFDILPKDEGWEINALRRGNDGRWYYRLSQTGKPQPGTVYYRTNDLSQGGERTGLEDYRNSARPEDASNAPSLLYYLIAAASGLPGVPVLRMISPELNGMRLFSPLPDAGEEFSPFFGYYRTEEREPLAFALLPNGEGFYLKDVVSKDTVLKDTVSKDTVLKDTVLKDTVLKDSSVFSFSLPGLPKGFVYTGAGLAGNILIATWEEQMDSAIGAAGFMALNADAPGLF